MPLTVADVANHLNAPTPAEGDERFGEMQRALNTAVEELERKTGRLQNRTETVQVAAAPYGRPIKLPYVKLTAVGAVRDSDGVPVTPAAVNLLAGLVWVDAISLGGVWLVECTGGPWPAAIETAALDWAAHVYDTQRTTLNPTADEDAALPSFAEPNRVSQFATPYALPGFG